MMKKHHNVDREMIDMEVADKWYITREDFPEQLGVTMTELVEEFLTKGEGPTFVKEFIDYWLSEFWLSVCDAYEIKIQQDLEDEELERYLNSRY